MKIKFSPKFIETLNRQVEFIARDKPSAAKSFKSGLIAKCKALVDNPYKCRQSIHYNEEHIRDLIYKGYVIIYAVGEEEISIFALTKYENY